jgi:hypothetical protein
MDDDSNLEVVLSTSTTVRPLDQHSHQHPASDFNIQYPTSSSSIRGFRIGDSQRERKSPGHYLTVGAVQLTCNAY